MSRVEVRESNRRKISRSRRRRQIQRNRRVALFVCLLLGTFMIAMTAGNISAHANQETYKYYTDVKVSENDTLWTIAKEYRTREYPTVKSYIDEVCMINGITTEIYAGQIIVVPYYSAELK